MSKRNGVTAASGTQRGPLRRCAGHLVRQIARVAFLLGVLFAAACAVQPSEDQSAKEEQQSNREKELQQRVDELEREKDEDLQRQIDELEAQQEEAQRQEKTQQEEAKVVVENAESGEDPTVAPEGVVVISPDIVTNTDLEGSALAAAVGYYRAVELGDYTYTYNALSLADQDNYTYDQWLYANDVVDSAAAEFEVFRALVDSPNTAGVTGYPHVADVGLTVFYPDGSLDTRYTYFVYEGGVWKHWLTAEEEGIFDSAL